jgi:enoyl-CoA hydratase/carnithine racemase
LAAIVFELDAESHVAVITIDRPDARNAVNGEVAEGIESALDQIEEDDSIWVSILTGTPPVFCAGADLKEINAGRARELQTKRGGFAGIVRRERKKPVIAAIDGPALAGGTEIALSCDLIVASTSATFGIPEVKRGIVAGGGGLFRLGRRIPFTVAMEWALTGDGYPAERAAELGLINGLCAPSEALGEAQKLAGRITANGPLAVQLSRQVMLETTYKSEDEGWSASRDAVRQVFESDDLKEGIQAFIEKRPPRWTGS